MTVRFYSSLAAVVVVAAISTLPVAAQTAAPKASAPAVKSTSKAWTPPRTAWGDPDLSGSYTNTSESGTPFERPAEFDGKRASAPARRPGAG